LQPKYLDSKGLVALWREGLLAKAVLLGATIGYKNHPQLDRFKKHETPVAAINTYLLNVYEESKKRSYKFNKNKLGSEFTELKINVTSGQMEYEMEHLKSKVKIRNSEKYYELIGISKPIPNPIFIVVQGEIETWEHV